MNELLELDPRHGAGLALRKEIAAKLRAAERAEQVFQQAAAKALAGELAACLELLEEAIRIHPSHQAAATLQEAVRQRMGPSSHPDGSAGPRAPEAADGSPRHAAPSRRIGIWGSLAAILVALLAAGYWLIPGPWRSGSGNQYGRAALEAFQKGDYSAADKTLAIWLTGDAGNREALALREQTGLALKGLAEFDAALREKSYDRSRAAVLSLTQLNAGDPNTPSRWKLLNETFAPERRDDFLGGMDLWETPKTWQAGRGRLSVRGAGIGTLRDCFYEDFEATFNVSFANGRGAVWILRGASDLSRCYLFQLTGPRGSPPNSFAAFKKTPEGLSSVYAPSPVGADLGKSGDQFTIWITAKGGAIEHRLEIASTPAETPFLLGKVVDSSLRAGKIGFGTKDSEEFSVLGFKIVPGPASPSH